MKQQIAASLWNNIQVSSLPFELIPQQSKLFRAFLSNPSELKRFYPNAVTSVGDLENYKSAVLAKYPAHRGEVCDALYDFNRSVGAGEATLKNIDILREADGVAVVTGQQAGLFTGPLYTIYKAISAIKTARLLSEKGVRAVPVFWAATEDHDFEEVASVGIIDKDGLNSELSYFPSGYTKDIPVGKVGIDNNVQKIIQDLVSILGKSEFSTNTQDNLSRSWKSGELWGRSFARNIHSLLGHFGLIVLDPLSGEFKRLAAPVFTAAIEKSEEIVREIRSRDEELRSAGFHSQVLVEEDYFPLFFHDDAGRRLPLKKTKNGTFATKGSNTEYTLSELKISAENDPSRFSPGVMLRPVVQDYLLPTVCYFGGAAEIAYFAQNSRVYEILGRPVTPIRHRQSFTIVEQKHQRTFEKYSLEFSDLFNGRDAVVEKSGRMQINEEIDNDFDEAQRQFISHLDQLAADLKQVDPTILDNLTKRRGKILYHLEALKKKTYKASALLDSDFERRITNLFSALLPKGHLQERFLNVNYFLNRYGPNFMEWVYEATDPNDQSHRIIYL